MSTQYRCFPCQNVFDTVEEWCEHSISSHGPDIFTAGGVQDPPPEEEHLPEDDESVLAGVRLILAHNYTSEFRYNLRPEIKRAIMARLAVDADPYWYYSDDYRTRPSARLTERGLEVAKERGYLWRCLCHVDFGGACRQMILSPDYSGQERCSGCQASYEMFGPPPPDANVPDHLCGKCTVMVMRRTNPTYTLPPRGR
jgi:hypothetical protein